MEDTTVKPSAKTLSALAAVAAAVLLLSVETRAGQTLRQVREKYIGQDAGLLIEKHGHPDQVFETQQGNKVYAYVKTKRRLYSVPIYVPPRTSEFDAFQPDTGTYFYGISNAPGTWAFEYRTRESRCTGYFEVDARHTIVGVSFKGEDCPE
jgi:hypothetical protein